MEKTIKQIVHDKKILESKITQTLVDFIQENPDVKLCGACIGFTECRDITNGIISTCVSTEIDIKIK